MPDGPSATARGVASYRLGFERQAAGFGAPELDDLLAQDVAGPGPYEHSERMTQYLRLRTLFFDKAVINALTRGARQVIIIAAGYDGRALRYAKPGVHWFEVDQPATQQDKLERLRRLGIMQSATAPSPITYVPWDLRDAGLAAALTGAGFQPEAPAMALCEGIAVYLDEPVLASLLAELRALATVGTRVALSMASPAPSKETLAERERLYAQVAALGEPARHSLSPQSAGELLARARWCATGISERAQRAGLAVLAPVWEPAAAGTPPTLGRVGQYLERTFHRAGAGTLGRHLHASYGIEVTGLRELDAGVYRVGRAGGPDWIARVFPAGRPLGAVHAQAGLLRWLAAQEFPAERCPVPEPVSTHAGQAVLVTEFAEGKRPTPSQRNYRRLGDLLGRLHAMTPVPDGLPPGGAWHHLASDGTPADEIAAALALLRDAEPRVHEWQREQYEGLTGALADADGCADLPHALVHPDFVPANTIAAPDGGIVILDWTGAGWGPRVVSLGFLLWAGGFYESIAHVDAVIEGYRAHVSLDAAELDRLAAAIGLRPLVMASWLCATGRERLADMAERVVQTRAAAVTLADRARAAFAGGRP